jgi:hypothetical protein
MPTYTRTMPKKRQTLYSLGALALASTMSFSRVAQAVRAKPLVEVWKSPTCGCCQDWIKHLEANGFQTKSYDLGNTAKRKEVGLPNALGSCHTAMVSGYVIEGHVPATEIYRLLKEKPVALGLTVPQMPIGSPGMDGPEYKGQKDRYDVLLVTRSLTVKTFASYHGTDRVQSFPL